MESKIGLVVMIGLPGSGKSTLVNSFSQFVKGMCADESQYKIHCITYDEIIPIQVQCGNGIVSWKTARDKVLEQVRTMICNIKDEESNEQRSSKILIIIDDNMYYRSMRYEYFQLARMYGLSFCQLYLCESVDKAIERNNQRSSHSVPEEVIHRMASKLQPPDPLHNTWERSSLTVSLENLKIEDISNFVRSSLKLVVQPISKSAETVEPSVIHKADLELRKLVGRIMRGERGDGEYMRSKAESLNAKRNEVLDKLRVRDILLPEEKVSSFLAQQFGMDDV